MRSKNTKPSKITANYGWN